MEADGLVQCAPRARDARVTDVVLRAAGIQALEKVLQAAGSQYERALAQFSDAETRQLQDFLQRLLVNLKRSPYE
jgi:DNA-binding MarR family transcriptional regulator